MQLLWFAFLAPSAHSFHGACGWGHAMVLCPRCMLKARSPPVAPQPLPRPRDHLTGAPSFQIPLSLQTPHDPQWYLPTPSALPTPSLGAFTPYRIVAISLALFMDFCLLQPANFSISRAPAVARLSWDPNTPSMSVIPWTPFRVLFPPLPLLSYLSLIILCIKLPPCWSHWMQWLTANSFQGEANQWQGRAPVPMRPPWETTCLTTLNIPQNVDAYAIKSLLLMNQWMNKKTQL